MSQNESSVREDKARGLVRIARARAKAELITQVRQLQVETGRLQEIANRLTDIATAIALANGLTAQMNVNEREKHEEGEGEG